MKAANLFEATRVLQRAKLEVLGEEHEIDRAAVYPQSDLDVMLLEHDKPDQEIFPNKDNQKPIESTIKGNTSITEVEKLLGL